MKQPACVKRVTLKDIALKTGYTVNTVSRALKNMPDISQDTCVKIQKAATKMGYVRNRMASALRSGKSGTIALIVCDLSNPFFSTMVTEVENAANAYEMSVLILSSYEDADTEERVVRTAIERQVDGILLCPCQTSRKSIQMIQEARIPYVLMARTFVNEEDDCVICNEEEGGYLAVKHLIEKGHQKIAFIYKFEHVYGIHQRAQGGMRAAREAGIPAKDFKLLKMLTENEAAQQLFYLHQKGFTACVIYCDMFALTVISAVQAQGLRVPEDMAFVSFDNMQERLNIALPLCSIAVPCVEEYAAAVELLHKRIEGEMLPVQKLVFPVKLICRNSCKHSESGQVGVKI